MYKDHLDEEQISLKKKQPKTSVNENMAISKQVGKCVK